MKLSNKQKNTLKVIKWFAPNWCDWSDKRDIKNLRRNVMGFGDIKYKWNAPSAATAYFAYTDRGIKPTEVNHIGRFLKLISGHKWMAVQKTMWAGEHGRKPNGEWGINMPSDLKEMPEYIQSVAAPYF